LPAEVVEGNGKQAQVTPRPFHVTGISQSFDGREEKALLWGSLERWAL
jgi:hypothetical protein